ncbi:reverse transcriptase family protein [Massilia sp. CCM 9210]|uniref:reverse transcriptase family protein n=1 Tax=Massilia scottii TaxID=3057166 RepID=UPI002796DA26|nr:reverse transcriptase family protein [Massilia sp. CCM 9210]MDQ1817748.1 reverse transcriptase family protein [Massilia sp. CCM 9210]
MAKCLYPLNQSPLYKIVGLGKLEAVLGIDVTKLDRLLSPDNYRVWINAKGREIQQPLKWLAYVHKRIGNLLARIELPEYVFSKKGRSYVDNAKYHTGNYPLGKTDISSFYPSTTRQMVWRMFSGDFECANDVADILADICCYRQAHLPTGSSLSGRVAFFAARSMFDSVSVIANSTASRMSLYVDDITLSGPSVSKSILADVRQVIRQHGLKTKKSKTKTFPADSPKMVTGAVVVADEVCLPNSRHKKIWETRQAIREAAPSERVILSRSLRGRMQEAQQIFAKGRSDQGECRGDSFVDRSTKT